MVIHMTYLQSGIGVTSTMVTQKQCQEVKAYYSKKEHDYGRIKVRVDCIETTQEQQNDR